MTFRCSVIPPLVTLTTFMGLLMLLVDPAHVRPLDREVGALAVEFAILLPLLVLFLAGAVTLGAAYREKQVITEAARYAGRLTTKFARPDWLCNDPRRLLSTVDCSALDAEVPPAVVDLFAKLKACDYLEGVGFDPVQWRISAEVSPPTFLSTGLQVQSLYIRLKRVTPGLYSLGGIIASPQADVQFLLQTECTEP